MSIEEFKELLDNGNIDDYIVLDMRNNHEYQLGHFKNAIPANTLTFRELEKEIENYKKQF
jgi:predicted sulfurtransferase